MYDVKISNLRSVDETGKYCRFSDLNFEFELLL